MKKKNPQKHLDLQKYNLGASFWLVNVISRLARDTELIFASKPNPTAGYSGAHLLILALRRQKLLGEF